MTTSADAVTHAIALVTLAIEAGADGDALADRIAPLINERTAGTSISGLIVLATLLAQLAANRGGDTPAEVLEEVGMAVAVHDSERGPNSGD
ncbi:hypothetical protein [Plantactinospora endophytica]|uniref:ANTAR domain-containing protein n=1 Tax=Plantactinospora endophytica TaxID=673535 RepID=A0ABQ4E211_9ACTN|nr:hypothetical protein [Plantactinospora endophytica]GIG88754.1 hypothetical protein Pen02_36900 [Plantactinospora endophytica]